MKRYASHYLCFQEKTLSQEVRDIIRRDEKQLQALPPSVLSTYPEGTKGFVSCVIELTPAHELVHLFPFEEEIESTEWHPGTLWLSELLRN